MHLEILNDKQRELLPLITSFKREYYLVGGTAIALHLGHRRSIDFDLFKKSRLNHKKTIDKIRNFGYPLIITRSVEEQMNLIVNDVKLTFFEYPFDIPANNWLESYAKLPTLLDLAAMKAFALGRRSKWKDYVDLYFIMKKYFSLEQIQQRAQALFGELFSEKLFRSQLSFYDNVDYSEDVDYLVSEVPSNEEIKKFLTDISIQVL